MSEHYVASTPIPMFNHEAFLSKIVINKDTECWEWIGAKYRSGHGSVGITKGEYKKSFKSHRLSWALFRDVPTPGLVIDHMCRNRACVNPDHLREVSHHTNWAENSESLTWINKNKSHCKYGHEFTPENTKNRNRGRVCQACYVRNYKEAVAKKKAQRILGNAE